MDTPVEVDSRRRTVELSLNEDAVRRAEALGVDLSTTVERLLVTFLDREEARGREKATLAEDIALIDAFHERVGLLSDEFPSL